MEVLKFHCVVAGCPFLVVRFIGQETQNAGLKIHKRVWKDNKKKLEKPTKETQRDAAKDDSSTPRKKQQNKEIKYLKWKLDLKSIRLLISYYLYSEASSIKNDTKVVTLKHLARELYMFHSHIVRQGSDNPAQALFR